MPQLISGITKQIIFAAIASATGAVISLIVTMTQLSPRMDAAEKQLLKQEVTLDLHTAKFATLETRLAADVGAMKADISYIRGLMEGREYRPKVSVLDYHWPDLSIVPTNQPARVQ